MAKKNKKHIKPIIFDTTLREGFQTPGGIGGSLEERLYAAALIQRYAHWLELGMPANNVDYGIISAIKDRFLEEKYPAGIAVLARCNQLDIERSAEVMKDYPDSLIHLFIGTSEEHRNIRFGGRKDVEGYKELIHNSVKDAASRTVFSRVMFSPEDAYRTFHGFPDLLIGFVKAAKDGYDEGNLKVGRDSSVIFNLPDTVGFSTIAEFGDLIARVKEGFGDSVELSVHSHNDSRMAVAQAIDVYQRFDVRWLQTTFGQLGERNGIASTDDIVKILSERGYLTDTRINSKENLKELDSATKAILWVLGREVPEEHIARVNVSTAGIHSDLVIKDVSTYHIRGDRYGSQPVIELGPTSGTKQVKDLLDKHNIRYDEGRIQEFTDILKGTANERKSPLSETHVLYEACVYFDGKNKNSGLVVKGYSVETWRNGVTRLRMEGSIDDKYFSRIHEANGPVEVAMEFLNRIINRHTGEDGVVTLESYKPRVIPMIGDEYLKWDLGLRPRIPRNVGKDAHLAVSLAFRNGEGIYHGWARDRNSTVTEIEAVIDGMTKMYALQKWGIVK